MDFIDIYRTFHPKTTEYTFFSSAHGTFSRIDHILDHKSSLGIFKKTEIVSSIFSNYNTMRLNISYRKKTVKNTNTWRVNTTLLNNQEITEEIKRKSKNTQKQMTMKIRRPKTYGIHQKLKFQEGSLQQYSPTQETRNISNKQPNITPKAIRERRTRKSQTQQKERNHKDQIRNK